MKHLVSAYDRPLCEKLLPKKVTTDVRALNVKEKDNSKLFLNLGGTTKAVVPLIDESQLMGFFNEVFYKVDYLYRMIKEEVLYYVNHSINIPRWKSTRIP